MVSSSPLADRLRPRTLAEFVGQDHIIGPGRLLRRAIQADQLSSLIFYGPPGTGKTTLARVIANTTQAHFIAINAVLAGVKEIRSAIATAQGYQQQGRRTVLFVDEVHRFNKAQQDALLPWVENGTVILIGATTENPYFEVNRALISRSRIFQLKTLTTAELHRVAAQALADPDRGYGNWAVQIDPDALAHLIHVANGDARTLLNALELAVETTPPDSQGQIRVTLAIAEDSIQQRAVLYDKEGDVHFDTISAFIKSLRGSDPDAALYWLARMVYAGEDPRYLFRRMLILAGEDVGLADPHAVGVVVACAAAFDRVGMPEGRYPLAQAALYLALTPKSNSVMGFFDALTAVEQEQAAEVPNPLKDSNRDRQGFGHGRGYLYPHAYREHWVPQQYLPSSLQGKVFYQPSDQGYEAQIQLQVVRRREAQLAAMVERSEVFFLEGLTYSPSDRQRDRWLQRTLSQVGDRLAQLRDRLFELAVVQRHHLILDLNVGTGLLTWEAVRQAPEGGVYACASSLTEVAALQEQALGLPELQRPVIDQIQLPELPTLLMETWPDVYWDRIIGRNVLSSIKNPSKIWIKNLIKNLSDRLKPRGKILLAEPLTGQAQRLYRLIRQDWISKELHDRLVEAEEWAYANSKNLSVHWQPDAFIALVEREGFSVTCHQAQIKSQQLITSDLIQRWFPSRHKSQQVSDQQSYAQHLGVFLTPEEICRVQTIFETNLQNQSVSWTSTIAYLEIWKPSGSHVA